MRITRELFDLAPGRYALVSGNSEGTPNCPFGNSYQWVGYDLEEKTFVRFSKSVFKQLIAEKEHTHKR